MSEEWVIEQEEIALNLFGNGGDKGGAALLLKMSPTNRTMAGKNQAVLDAVLRVTGSYFRLLRGEKEDVYNEVADTVEGYQLTMPGPANSREQFMKVEMAKLAALWARHSKNMQGMDDLVK